MQAPEALIHRPSFHVGHAQPALQTKLHSEAKLHDNVSCIMFMRVAGSNGLRNAQRAVLSETFFLGRPNISTRKKSMSQPPKCIGMQVFLSGRRFGLADPRPSHLGP